MFYAIALTFNGPEPDSLVMTEIRDGIQRVNREVNPTQALAAWLEVLGKVNQLALHKSLTIGMASLEIEDEYLRKRGTDRLSSRMRDMEIRKRAGWP